MILVAYLVIQFIVQYILYTTFRPLILSIGKLTYLIIDDVKITKKTLFILMLITNMAISVLVKYFTSDGAMAGLSNLGASTIIGLLMVIDINKLKLGDKTC